LLRPRPVFTIAAICFNRQVSGRDPILSAPFVEGSALSTAMYGMTHVIIGPEDNYFPAVSVIHFLVAVVLPIRDLPAIHHLL
jgi:hypothetical protein